MHVCTFFGHHDCPNSIRPKLQEAISNLIENYGVDMFYVGNQGQFDSLVRSVLRERKTAYPNIEYAVVLAYMPQKRDTFDDWDFSDTMLPDGIESVPKRFAIHWRNKWMLQQSDYVVTYVTHSWGGAATFAEMAERQKKTVINLAKTKPLAN